MASKLFGWNVSEIEADCTANLQAGNGSAVFHMPKDFQDKLAKCWSDAWSAKHVRPALYFSDMQTFRRLNLSRRQPAPGSTGPNPTLNSKPCYWH